MEAQKKQSIFGHIQYVLFFAAIFFSLRYVSWMIVGHTNIEGIIVFSLLTLFIALYIKNPRFAWYMVLGELLLGGAGNFLSLGGISIRSLFLITFLCLWVSHNLYIKKYRHRLHIRQRLWYVALTLIFFSILSAIFGIVQGHAIQAVVADAIPFLYLCFILPTYQVFNNYHDILSDKYIINLLLAFILSSALWSLFIFILFSSEAVHIHEPFYKWIRDIAGGKITDMGTGFFRIVFPEHLLLPGILLIFSSLLLKNVQRHIMWYGLLIPILLTIMLNLSRAYILGCIVGFLILLYKHKIKRWLLLGSAQAIICLFLFCTIHFFASGTQSFGLELLGIRTQSFIQPKIEESSYTRMSLLPPIVDLIKTSPIMGQGLGSTLTFISPITKTPVSTNQFDWGYLELWVELGLVGLASVIVLLGMTIAETLRNIQRFTENKDIYIGILAALIALMVIAVFGPVFTHVLGISMLAIVISLLTKIATDKFAR